VNPLWEACARDLDKDPGALTPLAYILWMGEQRRAWGGDSRDHAEFHAWILRPRCRPPLDDFEPMPRPRTGLTVGVVPDEPAPGMADGSSRTIIP